MNIKNNPQQITEEELLTYQKHVNPAIPNIVPRLITIVLLLAFLSISYAIIYTTKQNRRIEEFNEFAACLYAGDYETAYSLIAPPEAWSSNDFLAYKAGTSLRPVTLKEFPEAIANSKYAYLTEHKYTADKVKSIDRSGGSRSGVPDTSRELTFTSKDSEEYFVLDFTWNTRYADVHDKNPFTGGTYGDKYGNLSFDTYSISYLTADN